jgi:hypothetical protein
MVARTEALKFKPTIMAMGKMTPRTKPTRTETMKGALTGYGTDACVVEMPQPGLQRGKSRGKPFGGLFLSEGPLLKGKPLLWI